MKTFLSQLDWRYATKLFDETKKVSVEHENKILESIRKAPTSFGLQPFRIQVIKNPQIKNSIKDIGWNQPQYTSCSSLLVFITNSQIDQRISDWFDLASGNNADVKNKMQGYESMMRGFFKERSEDWLHAWAARQVYIALGFAMAACAELEIDSCPMEGFDSNALNKILNLSEHEKSCVVLTIGYRHQSEAPRSKVRFHNNHLFHFSN